MINVLLMGGCWFESNPRSYGQRKNAIDSYSVVKFQFISGDEIEIAEAIQAAGRVCAWRLFYLLVFSFLLLDPSSEQELD